MSALLWSLKSLYLLIIDLQMIDHILVLYSLTKYLPNSKKNEK